MSNRVSVIIPTYNRRDLLRAAVDSVLAQTYSSVELIVVNDGSTDGTDDMLRGYTGRITIIDQPNRGGTAARNAGIAAASGDFLTFLDHDDLLLPQKIESQMALFAAQPELDVVCSRWHYVDAAAKHLDTIGPIPTEGDVFLRLVLGCFLWSGSPIVRRRCLEKVGGFDESIWSSDWDMWVRIAGAGFRFGSVQIPLGMYRILSDSTMSDVQRTERSDIRIFEKIFAAPGLPPHIAAVQPQALATWRFWLSRRYFASGAWADAARNLTEALRLCPALWEDRAAFIETIMNEALDVRVYDAEAFIKGLLEHAPPPVNSLNMQRDGIMSQLYTGLALRAYAADAFSQAQHYLRQAVALSRDAAHFRADFAARAVAASMRYTTKPEVFIAAVFDHLPAEAAHLRTLRKRVGGDVNAGLAFELFFSGQRAQARKRILHAVGQRPSLLRNRGLLSIFVKSFQTQTAVKNIVTLL